MTYKELLLMPYMFLIYGACIIFIGAILIDNKSPELFRKIFKPLTDLLGGYDE